MAATKQIKNADTKKIASANTKSLPTDETKQLKMSESRAKKIKHSYKVKDAENSLLLKVKDGDQLAVINDVIAATGELDLKLAVKNRIIALDSFDAERRNTKQLVEDFKKAMAVSGDSMTFTVMSLASQLSE